MGAKTSVTEKVARCKREGNKMRGTEEVKDKRVFGRKGNKFKRERGKKN